MSFSRYSVVTSRRLDQKTFCHPVAFPVFVSASDQFMFLPKGHDYCLYIWVCNYFGNF